MNHTPAAIIRPAKKATAKTLYNVYAVVDGKPIARVNARRMSRELAMNTVSRLRAHGAARAYVIMSKQ